MSSPSPFTDGAAAGDHPPAEMGCVASKLDNEDAVRRCKERRRLMKQAVHARHHLAAAHHDYLHSLILTATALHDFAKGEPLAVSDQTPAVLLHSRTRRGHSPSPPPPTTPPPPRRFEPSPSPTIASSNLPPILSERGRSPPPQKKAFPKQQHHRRYPQANSSYSSTPSQASSVWNWESFYPPSPPSSDFFAARARADPDHAGSDSASCRSADDAAAEAAERAEREEVQCSDWGDHDHDRFSTTSTSTSDAGEDDRDSKSEAPTRSEIGSEAASNFAPSRAPSISDKFARPAPEKSEAGYSAAPAGGGGELGELQLVVRHRNLAEIMAAIKDYFQRAAAAGEAVSDLLETSRAQFDRSFRQLKSSSPKYPPF